jgi:hypothetical protein
MSCNLTTTTTKCVPCIHPLDYLFEKVGRAVFSPANDNPFQEIVDRILDRGIIEPNCGICCSDCDDVYVLASVETYLKFWEAMYSTQFGGCTFQGGCCVNVLAAVETYLKYEEAAGNDDNSTCCNGFTECSEELFCWMIQGSSDPEDDKDRILDKGIVEQGNIVNNCTGVGGSDLCKFTEFLAEYYAIDKRAQITSKSEIVDRILDKGIVFYCNPETGEIVVASVETFLKYAENIGIICSAPAIPAPTSITETTTTVVEITTTTETTTESVVETTTETTTVAIEPVETTTTTTIIETV